ncbi:MAG: hypothetical protein V8S34_02030 [Lawsonibacter sp.]
MTDIRSTARTDHQRRRNLCPVGQLRRRLRHREEGHHRRGAGAGRPDVDLLGDSTAIACNKSTEVTIVAADGTVNTLADTEQNNDETYPDNDSAETPSSNVRTLPGHPVRLRHPEREGQRQKRRQVRGHHRRGGRPA